MATNPFQQELQRRQSSTEARSNPFQAELARRRPPADTDSLLENVVEQNISSAKSFVGGALDVIGLPADLVNIPLRALDLPTIGGSDTLREMGSSVGIAYEREEEPSTIGNRASRILGGAALPYLGVAARGQQLANQGVRTASSALDDVALSTARNPGRTFAAETASVAGATAGGEVAEAAFPDSEWAEVFGELLGGLTPAAVMSGPAVTLAKKGANATKRSIFPFTESGGKQRAANRLQSAAANPEDAVIRLDAADTLQEAPLSPARRTGDKRLLAIERAVANEDPALDAKLTEELSEATRVAREGANLGGESARVRTLLEGRRDYLLGLVERRAEMAGRQAQEAIESLDPDASPREISRAAREKVEAALEDAQTTENQLWGVIDKKAPASLNNARAALKEELAQRSRFEDPADIPGWLKKPLTTRRGKVHFGDVHALRKRVLKEIREERAKPAPNRNKIRILSNVQEALLDDMGSAQGQGEALDAAREFSRTLNEKFRQGAVGRLLGYERQGGLAVSGEDTLRRIISGEASGTQVEQFLRASPNARGEVMNYLRASFLVQTMEDGKFNARAARTFLKKHDAVLERFPDLRTQLTDTRELNRLAARLADRRAAVERLAYNAKKSRAALYLDGPLGEEWSRVLKAENPAAVARSLRRKVHGDPKALQGLKSSFVEELIRRAETRQFDEAGQQFVSGNRLKKLLEDYRGVAAALNMSEGERARLQRVANTFSRIETQPSGREAIMEDRPAAFLDLLARWMGAQSGQRIASGGTGSSLVMAQAFSQRMRNTLQRLTRDKATELLSAAIEDPQLFRELMVRPTASVKVQDRAAQRINAWLASPITQAAEQEPE